MRNIFITLAFLVPFFAPSLPAPEPASHETVKLLHELGRLVETVPDTLDACQAKIRDVQTWQKARLGALAKSVTGCCITSPKNETGVAHRVVVEGTADAASTVCVVVHPTETSDFWVQPRPTLKSDGTWRTTIYIGRAGTIDSGKQFEVIAVSNPKDTLREGQVLRAWPTGESCSEPIVVTRQ